MSYGSVLAKVSRFSVTTADNITREVYNNPITRLAIKFFGIPHIGLRLRARYLIKLLDLKKTDSLLDAGCGMGLFLLSQSQNLRRGYGVDINEEKISEAQRLKAELSLDNLEFARTDLTREFSRNEKFDKILCSEVLEHVADDRVLVKCLAAQLAPNGRLIATTPSCSRLNVKYQHQFGHVRAGYTKAALKELFESAGLVTEEIIPYGLCFSRIAWQLNRKLLRNVFLNTLSFYPLLGLTYLDWFNAASGKAETEAMGYAIKLKKN